VVLGEAAIDLAGDRFKFIDGGFEFITTAAVLRAQGSEIAVVTTGGRDSAAITGSRVR
jgi:hypothetical protein